jgi:parvulin-like peptidyl-prolyl isomerase
VGDAVLTEADLAEALGASGASLDSTAARQQIVEQWVQRELLVQEARAQGLDQQPDIRRMVEQSERATLEAAALDHHFESNPVAPTEADLQAYYTTHRAALALREPYVRLRHLRTTSARAASAARDALARAGGTPLADSLFAITAREYADDPDGARALAREFVPEGRLAEIDEQLATRVATLAPGADAVVIPSPPHYHVVQVAARLPAGATAPLAVLRPELTERLTIQMRRDMEARLLERLRAEAQARNRLEIR